MFPLNPSPLLRLSGLDPYAPMTNGGGGKTKVPKPDPNIGRAAVMSAETGNRALDWYMKLYDQDAPYRDAVYNLSMQQAQADLDASKQNQAIADDYYNYMQTTFRPVEKGIVDDAQKFSTEAERERLASEAASDVSTAGANQRTQLARSLASMGVNPSSPKYAALMSDQSISEAAMRAGAMTKSRQISTDQGWARRMDAASIGRNLPANQATSQGIALAAGGEGLKAAQVPGQQAAMYGALGGQGYSAAMQGYNQMGNILNTQYGTRVNAAIAQNQAAAAESAGMWGAVGTAGGMAAAAFI